MLDPITSLGLAGNIVQLVDFGLKTVARGRELATTGATAEHTHLGTLVKDLSSICSDLEKQTLQPREVQTVLIPNQQQQRTESEQAIRDLAYNAKGVAGDLATLLQSLSLNTARGDGERPSKRRRVVATRLLKGMWKEKELQALRLRMTELQQQMMLRLSVVQTLSSSALLTTFWATAQTTLQQHCDRLGYGNPCGAINGHVSSQMNTPHSHHLTEAFVRKLDGLIEQVRTVTACQYILRSLAYGELHDREETILDAHANTFGWVFDKQEFGFADWASTKSGIFWITGKPGSGKSTLMKHLIHHPRTRELLHTWAGHDGIATAHHYFWNAGSVMQKSQVGLLRTLLYQLIQQAPEAALDVVPARFKQCPKDQFVAPWTYPELCYTIKALSTIKRLGARVCLFIDGLDEHIGDQTSLVELLSVLTKNTNIKVCASSRPWNVFTRAFDTGGGGQLAMQDVTRSDIQTYIRNTLGCNSLFRKLREQDVAQLVNDMTIKAQGVFLWVHLAVRSLLRGLGNDDDFAVLTQRLSEYPDDLDMYYQRMFDRIETVYHQHSARIILAASRDGNVSFWAPRCIDLELQCPDYALLLPEPDTDCETSGKTSQSASRHSLNEPRIHGRCMHHWSNYLASRSLDRYNASHREELRTYLDARCSDFLEIHASGIRFLHRTAKDFLERSAIRKTLSERASADYDVELSFARLLLARIKLSSHRQGMQQSLLERLITHARGVDAERLAEYLGLLDCLHDTGAAYGVVQLDVGVEDGLMWVTSQITGGGERKHDPVQLRRLCQPQDKTGV